MLPGLRFIFLTAMLSISLVVFGLGMLGMLRSTKERFATTTLFSRDVAPVMVQQPMIALLRTEPFEPDTTGIDTSDDIVVPDVAIAMNEAPALAPTVAAQPPAQTIMAAGAPAPDKVRDDVAAMAEAVHPLVTERTATLIASEARATAGVAAVAVPAEQAVAAAEFVAPAITIQPEDAPALVADLAPPVAKVTAEPAIIDTAKPALPANTELTETEIAIEPTLKLETPSSKVADATMFGPDDQPAPPVKIAEVKLPRERPIIGMPASELAKVPPADATTQVAAHAVDVPQTTGSIPSVQPHGTTDAESDLAPSIPLDAAEVKLPRGRPSPEKAATKTTKPTKKKRGRQASDDRTMVQAPQQPAEYRASTINLF